MDKTSRLAVYHLLQRQKPMSVFQVTSTKKTIKIASLAMVSLIALSTASKVNAACVGSPTLDCTGATTGILDVDAPITTLNFQAGSTFTAGPDRVDAVTIRTDLTVNNDGLVENTATGTYAGGLVTRNNDVDLIVNNNAAGVVRVLGSIRSVAVGSDGISSSLINSLTVNNAGLIEVTNNNAYAIAGGENADVITNTGTISGRFTLLDGDDVVTNNGGTINAGNIDFGGGNDTLTNTAVGVINIDTNKGSTNGRIRSTSGDFTLNNDGSIIGTGSRRGSDLIDGASGALLTVNNTGTIHHASTGTGLVWAIRSHGTSMITNSGSIMGDQGYAIYGRSNTDSDNITNTATGNIDGWIRLSNSDDVITNDGAINGRVTMAGGDDIFSIDLDTGSLSESVDGGTHSAGDILNIDSDSGNATISGNTYFGFETINLSGDNEFTTNDTITADAVNLLGNTDIVVASGSDVTTDTLTGATGNDVTVDAGGRLTADTTLSAADETVTINGEMTGDIDLGAGDDVLAINLDTGAYSGNADGGAHAAGDDLNITSGSGENLDLGRFTNFENLTLDGDGKFTSINGGDGTYDSVSLLGNTDLALGNGTVITSSGSFTGAGTNEVTIGADAIINADSFSASDLVFDVATDTSFGVLNVTGGPLDLTGVNVSALVTNAVTDADEVQVATGTGPLIGVGGGAGQAFVDIDDTSLLFNFGMADGSQGAVTTSVDSNSLFIVADKVFLIRQVIEEGNEANVGEVLEVLETIPPGINDPQIQAVLGKVNSASDVEELTNVLQATLPALDGGSFSATQNVTGNTLRLVSDRLTVIRDHVNDGGGVSSGDLTRDVQMWGQVFGQKIKQGQRKGSAGYRAYTQGVTVGVDSEAIHDDATIGVATTYANTNVVSRSLNNTRSDINSYNISLYGDYDLSDNSYVVGDLGYTYGDNESTRFNIGNVAGLNGDSDFGSHQLEARVIAARDYRPEALKDVRVTPKVQAHYINYQTEDIKETGAGGAGLNVESDALNILEFGVGLDVRKDYTKNSGAIVSPEINLGYRYDVIGDAVQTTSTFSAGGPSFTSEGTKPAQGTLNLGTGIGYTTTSNTEFTASYDYERKDKFNSHSALIRAAVPF